MTKFSVPDMHCDKCQAKVEDAVAEADEGALIDVDLVTRTVEIDSVLEPVALIAAMSSAGYAATSID